MNVYRDSYQIVRDEGKNTHTQERKWKEWKKILLIKQSLVFIVFHIVIYTQVTYIKYHNRN